MVKASFDISFHNPGDTCKGFLHLTERSMAASFGPEAVRVVAECRLIDCFQNHSDYFLHQLIVGGSNPQWAEFSIFLWNILSLGRFWLVRPVANGFNDPVDSRQTHTIQCLSVYPLRHAPLRLCNVGIGKKVEFRIVQIAIQSFVLVVAYTCLFFKAFQDMNRISHGVSHTILSVLKMIHCSPSPCGRPSRPRTTMGTLLSW